MSSGDKAGSAARQGAGGRGAAVDPATAFQHALAFYQAGQFVQAKRLCQEILKHLPDQPEVINLQGAIAIAQGDFVSAASCFRQVSKLRPADAAAHSNLGVALRRAGRLGEALASFDRALSIAPNFMDALRNRTVTLLDLSRHVEALADCDRALAMVPGSAALLCNRGSALMGLGRREEALESFERAIGLDPGFATAVYNRGNVLRELNRLGDALASYDFALRLSPKDVDVAVNRGIVLCELDRHGEALAGFEQALTLKPDSVDAMRNRAIALERLNRFEEAARQLERLLQVNPRHKYVRGDLLYNKLRCCEWSHYRKEIRAIETGITGGEAVASPGVLPALSASASVQLEAALSYCRDRYPSDVCALSAGSRRARDKIRIAYLFHHHATAHLLAGVFEAHDRSLFDISAWSFGPEAKDGYRKRLQAAFDQFIDVRQLGDRAIAERMAAQEIDIAIDLKAYTEGGRLGVLACRPAPVQVNFLGFPGTSGAPYIDYLLADRTIIPAAEQRFYSEKIVYLPDCYQPNDSKRRIDPQSLNRRDAGHLRRGGLE